MKKEEEYFTALILLPTKYNPDLKGEREQIPMDDFQITAVEIQEKFNQFVTIDPFPKLGIWKKLGVLDNGPDSTVKDTNVILEFNLFPKSKIEKFIKYCRNTLIDRFDQESILIKFIPEPIFYKPVLVEKRESKKKRGGEK